MKTNNNLSRLKATLFVSGSMGLVVMVRNMSAIMLYTLNTRAQWRRSLHSSRSVAAPRDMKNTRAGGASVARAGPAGCDPSAHCPRLDVRGCFELLMMKFI